MLLASIYSHKSFPGNLAVPLPVPMDHFLSEEWWQSCLAEEQRKSYSEPMPTPLKRIGAFMAGRFTGDQWLWISFRKESSLEVGLFPGRMGLFGTQWPDMSWKGSGG